MLELCPREITQLHQFFQSWFNGEIDDTDDQYDRLEHVLASEFVLITPEGMENERSRLIRGLRSAHGGNRDNPVKIWVEDIRCRHHEGNVAVFTYHEWQEKKGDKKGRLSTVLFRRKDEIPEGVEWLHVHETWLTR